MSNKLNPRQTKFCQLFAKSGNAFQAYSDAGYSVKSEAGAMVSASKLLRNAKIAVYLKELSDKCETKAIMSLTEVKEFWTKVALSDEEEMPHRLKASEMIAKSVGGFIDVKKVETNITIQKGLDDYYSEVDSD